MNAFSHFVSLFKTRAPLFVALFTLLIPSLLADVVHLSNGDRITGEVLRLEGEKLELKTDYAGTIKISWTKVAEIDLDEDLQLKVADDEVLNTRGLVRRDGGRVALATKTGELEIDENDLKVLNPTPAELGVKGKFEGRVNLSWKGESGNNEKSDLDADYSISYKRGDHRFDSRGAIEYDDRDNAPTKRDWNIAGSYNYYFREKVFGSYWYQAKQEKGADLELRQITGPLVGYQFFDEPKVSLLGQLGVFYVNEKYFNETGDVFWGPGFHTDYEHKLFNDRLTFYHNNYFLMDINNSGKYLWQSWTGFRHPIAGGIVGSIEYELDFDSSPASRAEKLDQTTRIKIGFEW